MLSRGPLPPNCKMSVAGRGDRHGKSDQCKLKPLHWLSAQFLATWGLMLWTAAAALQAM